jgi:hypothetical protein
MSAVVPMVPGYDPCETAAVFHKRFETAAWRLLTGDDFTAAASELEHVVSEDYPGDDRLDDRQKSWRSTRPAGRRRTPAPSSCVRPSRMRTSAGGSACRAAAKVPGAESETATEWYSVPVTYPLPQMNVQVRGGLSVSARWSAPGTSPRIPHDLDIDRQRDGVSAGQRVGGASRAKRRIPVATHTPRGYGEGPPTGKRPAQRPFSQCGRCRIRTCVGIRRRIYRTTLPTR